MDSLDLIQIFREVARLGSFSAAARAQGVSPPSVSKAVVQLEARFGDPLFMRQLLALRLAVILCHARQDPETQHVSISADAEPAQGFTLSVGNGWAERWPQSAHLLREEVIAWQKTPWGLRLRASGR